MYIFFSNIFCCCCWVGWLGRVMGVVLGWDVGWCSFLPRFAPLFCCCLPSPLRSGAFLPGLFGPVLFFSGNPPKGGRGRQLDQKKEETKQPQPQGREGKAAPLKWRRRDHHSTELNFTSVNLTNLNLLLFIERFH